MKLWCKVHVIIRYTHGRKSWGDGGDVPPPPPMILKVGDTISNVPPRFCGRTIFRRKNRIFNKFVDLFFFWLVRMSDSDRRVPLICRKKIVNADGAAKKSVGVPPPPPPRSSAFLGVARLWAGGVPPPPNLLLKKLWTQMALREKKVSESPPPPPLLVCSVFSFCLETKLSLNKIIVSYLRYTIAIVL